MPIEDFYMKTFMLLLAGSVFLLQNADARCDRKCKSERNKAAAEAFCKNLTGTECKVDNNRTCGPGWKDIKKFDDGGDSWFACVKTNRQENSDRNKKEAEDYCKANFAPGECVVSEGGCGRDLKDVKHFRGPGRNFSSCVRTRRGEASEENRKQAEEFCNKVASSVGAILECRIERKNCSGKFKQVKEFKGKGDDWAVCLNGK
jgi:hypothetical protein